MKKRKAPETPGVEVRLEKVVNNRRAAGLFHKILHAVEEERADRHRKGEHAETPDPNCDLCQDEVEPGRNAQ